MPYVADPELRESAVAPLEAALEAWDEVPGTFFDTVKDQPAERLVFIRAKVSLDEAATRLGDGFFDWRHLEQEGSPELIRSTIAKAIALAAGTDI